MKVSINLPIKETRWLLVTSLNFDLTFEIYLSCTHRGRKIIPLPIKTVDSIDFLNLSSVD